MKRPAKPPPDLPAYCAAIAAGTAHLSANGPRWISLVTLAKGMRVEIAAVVDLTIAARELGLVTVADTHSVCLTAKGRGSVRK